MNTTTTDYELVVDYSPVYELLVSMSVFLQSKNHKSLEAGNEWIRSVQERFAPDFAEKNAVLVSTNELPLEMMILHSPAKHSVEAFLTWFEGLTVGELYEQTAPYVRSVSTDLTTERDYFAWIMREWYETYFKHIDPAILTGLAADAEEKRQLLATMEQGDLLELATKGIRLTPAVDLKLLILAPQYHARPINVADHYRNSSIYMYSADVVPAAEDEPSCTLLRLMRSLSDERRLKILRHMADCPRTFTELVQFSGLAKSTVHHHLLALRAAGLVRAHTVGFSVEKYSLRGNALDEMRNLLGTYLKEL